MCITNSYINNSLVAVVLQKIKAKFFWKIITIIIIYIDHFEFYKKSHTNKKKIAIMITFNLNRKKSWNCPVSLLFMVLKLFNLKVFKELQHKKFGSIKKWKIKKLSQTFQLHQLSWVAFYCLSILLQNTLLYTPTLYKISSWK